MRWTLLYYLQLLFFQVFSAPTSLSSWQPKLGYYVGVYPKAYEKKHSRNRCMHPGVIVSLLPGERVRVAMISHNLPIGNPREPIEDFDETEITGNVDLGPPKEIQMSDAKPYYIKGNLVKPMDETNLNKLNEALQRHTTSKPVPTGPPKNEVQHDGPVLERHAASGTVPTGRDSQCGPPHKEVTEGAESVDQPEEVKSDKRRRSRKKKKKKKKK